MKFLVFIGSVRDSMPPRPRRLGLRVATALSEQLGSGSDEVKMIDPLSLDVDRSFKPHFAYAPGKAPRDLQEMAEDIMSADGYLMVSPEYNHAMSPALADLLNHFGSSLFSYKPSAIATYSSGQWGGARAAVNLRTFLSELGCLPVSAMIHVPKAHEVFDEAGGYHDSVDASAWDSYMDRTLSQLRWWAGAASHWRKSDQDRPAGFVDHPSQRNAP